MANKNVLVNSIKALIKSKTIMAFMLICSILLLTFFTTSKPEEYSHIFDERFNMNTLMKIDIWSNKSNLKSSKKSLVEAFATIEKVNEQTDRYNNLTKFGLHNLNKLQIPKIIETKNIPSEYKNSKHLVNLIVFLNTHNSPYFKADIASLIDLWNTKKETTSIPTKKEISEALIASKNKGTLDLGGIAKGYAVDRAYEELIKNTQVKAALINSGGNIRVLGLQKNKKNWKIGIQHPREKSRYLGIITLKPGESVATSGDYQRYYKVNGKRYHHILNPKTGYPARGLISVTVLAKNAELADYYSTLLFVAGLDKAKEILKQKPELGAIIMNFNQELYVSPNLKESFKKEV